MIEALRQWQLDYPTIVCSRRETVSLNRISVHLQKAQIGASVVDFWALNNLLTEPIPFKLPSLP